MEKYHSSYDLTRPEIAIRNINRLAKQIPLRTYYITIPQLKHGINTVGQPFSYKDLGQSTYSRYRIFRAQHFQAYFEQRFTDWGGMPSGTKIATGSCCRQREDACLIVPPQPNDTSSLSREWRYLYRYNQIKANKSISFLRTIVWRDIIKESMEVCDNEAAKFGEKQEGKKASR
jgi:hypothetical protein